MWKQLNERLQALKTEFEAGQKMLAELEQQRVGLEQKMLRISGAIQVLAEELEKAEPGGESKQEHGATIETGSAEDISEAA